MLPSYYEFYNPVKLLSGSRALDNLPSELEILDVRRPLIITDTQTRMSGLIKQLKQSLAGSGIIIGAIFDDIKSVASKMMIDGLQDIYRHNRCDSIVAIGGKTVVDAAKGVNISNTYGPEKFIDVAGADLLTKPMNPLLVIPISYSSGNELSDSIVIYDEKQNLKLVFSSSYLRPSIVIIDPKMKVDLAPENSAAEVMGALANAIEASICLQKNPLSDAYASTSVELIRKNLIPAVQTPEDQDIHMALMNACVMAGISFSNAMVGVVHALATAASEISGLSYGVAAGIFLPWGLEYNLGKSAKAIAKMLLPLSGPEEYSRTGDDIRAIRSIEIIRGLQQTLNDICSLPMTLKAAGVSEGLLGEMAESAVNNPAVLMNPREMDKEDALKIIEQAYH